ncbi:MAG: FAD-dependent oxidoreductase [Sandaracinaceae bacterium]
MSALDVDVLVVGGGLAGLEAARVASAEGAVVALVDPGPLGGRATHGTLTAWRALADASRRDRESAWGEAQRAHQHARERHAELHALRLEDHGVSHVVGRGAFTRADGERGFEVKGGPRVTFERAIVATGGRPRTLGRGARVLTPDRLLDLAEAPKELLVVGGGAAGAELADAMVRLGATVTWMMDELGILPEHDRELAESVGDVLMGRGVKLVHGIRVAEVTSDDRQALARLEGGRTYAAPIAVVAVGTEPAIEDLGLAHLDLTHLAVDERCETSAPGIFAAGDCTPRCAGATASVAMGRIAGLRATDRDAAPWDPEAIPRAVHTDPAVAQVGLTPERAAGRPVSIVSLRLEETLLGALRGVGSSVDAKGFLRLVCDERDVVLGASAVGPGAVEAVDAVAIAMRVGATRAQLASASVTLGARLEALVACAR